jgi:four helix bundle protein
MAFDHERLDVYRLAIEFISSAENVASRLPRGRGYLADQLRRASLSIVLNIAEGAGEFSGGDKAQFYARARGSATESAAVIDVCLKLDLMDQLETINSKTLLERVVQMLTKLIQSEQWGPPS